MSRRKSHGVEFGSDSFLDVLANMVGILIMLIVIAGMRVGRAPAEEPVDEPEPQAVATVGPAAPIPAPAPAIEEPPVPELEPDDMPQDVAAEMRRIDRELDQAAREAAAIEAELARRSAAAAGAREQLAASEQAVQENQKELQADKQRIARLQQALGERREKLRALLAEFEEARNAAPAAIEVQHRLTPVSQEVTGEELHFRLSAGRVSVVPFSQLEERVKLQLERQKEWLARHARNEGTVGPIDGYSLKYVVERQSLPAILERKLGHGGFRIVVSRVEIVPEGSVVCETAQEALRRGSNFARALQGAGAKATLTFWVYPDSYRLFRQLQEAAHAEGFVVAARPLPDGVPIAGAPSGSRSAGQ